MTVAAMLAAAAGIVLVILVRIIVLVALIVEIFVFYVRFGVLAGAPAEQAAARLAILFVFFIIFIVVRVGFIVRVHIEKIVCGCVLGIGAAHRLEFAGRFLYHAHERFRRGRFFRLFRRNIFGLFNRGRFGSRRGRFRFRLCGRIVYGLHRRGGLRFRFALCGFLGGAALCQLAAFAAGHAAVFKPFRHLVDVFRREILHIVHILMSSFNAGRHVVAARNGRFLEIHASEFLRIIGGRIVRRFIGVFVLVIIIVVPVVVGFIVRFFIGVYAGDEQV